jgi:hypothetical protein
VGPRKGQPHSQRSAAHRQGDKAAGTQKEVRPVRRLFSFHVSSVDGYYEGPNQEFDWPIVDQEFNQFGLQQLEEVDTLLFGCSGASPTS